MMSMSKVSAMSNFLIIKQKETNKHKGLDQIRIMGKICNVWLFTGYLIPKGWKVQAWYRSVHMDPEVYPDPKDFNPSRWDVSNRQFFCCFLCMFLYLRRWGSYGINHGYKDIHICRETCYIQIFCPGYYTQARNFPSLWRRKQVVPWKWSGQIRDLCFPAPFSPWLSVSSFSLHFSSIFSPFNMQHWTHYLILCIILFCFFLDYCFLNHWVYKLIWNCNLRCSFHNVFTYDLVEVELLPLRKGKLWSPGQESWCSWI